MSFETFNAFLSSSCHPVMMLKLVRYSSVPSLSKAGWAMGASTIRCSTMCCQPALAIFPSSASLTHSDEAYSSPMPLVAQLALRYKKGLAAGFISAYLLHLMVLPDYDAAVAPSLARDTVEREQPWLAGLRCWIPAQIAVAFSPVSWTPFCQEDAGAGRRVI